MRAALALAILASCAAFAQENPAARYHVISAPDCAGPGNIIAEAAPDPRNVTFIRVQHIGDPGTAELAGEVANPVTWDVGTLTGLSTVAEAQRGYRDAPPPVASSAFQLQCGRAGFLINSFTFSHAQPLFGEGPSAGVNRAIDDEIAFDGPRSALVIEGRVAVPTAYSPNRAPDAGVTAVSFYYYVRDTRSGIIVAHVIGLFDNRPPGVGGAGNEILANDGITPFAASPLARLDGSGAPVRFVDASPYSETMRYEAPWSDPLFFRAEVPYDRFRAMLEALRPQAPAMSVDPLDYRVIFFGVLGEVFVGTDRAHDVMLGASVRDLTLLRVSERRFRR